MSKLPLIISTQSHGENPVKYHLYEHYGMAVSAAGGVLVSTSVSERKDQLDRLIETMDGLLLPGGGDPNPKLYNETLQPWGGEGDDVRDKLEYQLIERAMKKNIPILAVCRGLQIANVYFGGSLHQDIAHDLSKDVQHDNHDKPRNNLSHNIKIAKSSKLFSLVGDEQIMVNSLHHQGIKTLGRGAVATAWSDDGLIEAFEMQEHPWFMAVQWHPEELIDNPKWLNIYKDFIEACKK